MVEVTVVADSPTLTVGVGSTLDDGIGSILAVDVKFSPGMLSSVSIA